MRDYIVKQVLVERRRYEQALRRFEDKARHGLASGALSVDKAHDIRRAAWSYDLETPLGFTDVEPSPSAPVQEEAPHVAPEAQHEARAVTEGEDLA